MPTKNNTQSRIDTQSRIEFDELQGRAGGGERSETLAARVDWPGSLRSTGCPRRCATSCQMS